MFPMVAVVEEFDQGKEMVEHELTYLRRHGHTLPERVEIGVMVEVPSLLFQLDDLLPVVDFLSVGSNDLVPVPVLGRRPRQCARRRTLRRDFGSGRPRASGLVARKGREHRKPVTLCGELASKPIGALMLVLLWVIARCR